MDAEHKRQHDNIARQIATLFQRLRKLEQAPYRETCEKVEESVDLPPRASWGDSDARLTQVTMDTCVVYVVAKHLPDGVSVDDLPATTDPSKWKYRYVEGGIYITNPECADLIYDCTTHVLGMAVTTERDARLVDRSRR